jgi:hypothetical protein
MGYGRVCVDIFQISLYTSGESSVNDRDTGQYQEYPGKFVSGFRH